jgi:hypothetical protein
MKILSHAKLELAVARDVPKYQASSDIRVLSGVSNNLVQIHSVLIFGLPFRGALHTYYNIL